MKHRVGFRCVILACYHVGNAGWRGWRELGRLEGWKVRKPGPSVLGISLKNSQLGDLDMKYTKLQVRKIVQS